MGQVRRDTLIICHGWHFVDYWQDLPRVEPTRFGASRPQLDHRNGAF